MSQDALYKYLTDHDIYLQPIATLMGKNVAVLLSDFRHHKNNKGNLRYFSVENIGKLNAALPQLAEQLRSCAMTFGTDQTYTNQHGRTYDPGMIEPMKRIGKYMNLTTLVNRVLGWNKGKKMRVITDTTSKAYGNISEQDVAAVNAEVLAVAGVLDNIEVMPDVNAFEGYGSSSSSDGGTAK